MSIKDKSLSGIGWNGLRKITFALLSFGINATLARLLGPAVFGIMGMVKLSIRFMRQINKFGFSNAIIATDNLNDEKLSTLFYVNMLIGISMLILLFFASPLIALGFDNPELTNYLKVISIVFLIRSISFIQESLLKKEMKFREIYFVRLLGFIFYGIIAITLAIRDYGVWSLVIAYISRVSIRTIGYYFFNKWTPKIYFNIFEVIDLIKHGLYVLANSLLIYFKRNLDYILIGGILGSEALGIYSLAYKIMLTPVRKIGGVINSTFFPSFSKMNNKLQVKKYYSHILQIISLISFPLMAGLFIMAPEFIKIFFGNEWIKVIPVIRILCFVGMIQSLTTTCGTIYYSQKRPDIPFKFNLISLIVLAIFFYFGSLYGIIGVSWFYLIYIILTIPVRWYLISGLINFEYLKIFQIIKKPTIYTTTMFTILFTIKMLFEKIIISNLILFIMLVPIGIIIYLISIYFMDKEYWLERIGKIMK